MDIEIDYHVDKPHNWDPTEDFLEKLGKNAILIIPAFFVGITIGTFIWVSYNIFWTKCTQSRNPITENQSQTAVVLHVSMYSRADGRYKILGGPVLKDHEWP